MNFGRVVHYLSLLCAVVGTLMLIPLVCALIYGEDAWSAFLIGSLGSLALGAIGFFATFKQRGRLRKREALAIVVLAWIVVALLSTIPYLISDTFTNFTDALFESMSGITTTGASVMTDVDGAAKSILLWRSLSQWVGGMGIIMLFVALFPVLGIGASSLAEAEMPAYEGERLRARMSQTAKTLWFAYLGISATEFILLLTIGSLPLYDAMCVTFSTTPLGGFASTGLSIAAYNSLAVEIIVMLFMVASGVNFGLYFFAFRGQGSRLWKSTEFRVYIAILLIATIVVHWDLVSNLGMGFLDALRYGTFNVVSVGTTTGFFTADFASWPVFSQAVLLILMVVGASAGSTSGALKVIRVVVVFKYIMRRIRHTFNPDLVEPIKVGGNVVSEQVVNRTNTFVLLYFGVLWIGFIIMSFLGLSFIDALSSVTATIGNVGPALGSLGPLGSYAEIPALGKYTLMFLMMAGRLELFTLFALFVPSFWRWK